MSIWMIMIFLLIGFLVGYFRLLPVKFFSFTDIITQIGLITLLTAMGAKIGVDKTILNQIEIMGFKAFLLAAGSILGSVFLVNLFAHKFIFDEEKINNPRKRKYTNEESISAPQETNNSTTYVIIISVLGGILSGLFLIPDTYISTLDSVTTYALFILLFGVGIGLGQNKEIFIQIKESGFKILLIPCLVVSGTLIGSVITGAFLNLGYNESAAIGAGFGWYSLSGILLSRIHSVYIGSLAFLTNVFRELLTIMFLPFIVKYFGKITSIAPGGATTMDVTLPIIKETAGEEMIIPAFVNGAILSMIVPILVPFLINL